MTFSSFDEHSTPLFRLLATMELSDLVAFHIALFMHKFHNKLLPSYFDSFLIQYLVSITTVHEVQQINLITSYGIFNIRFKDQRYGTLLGKILSQPLSVN